MNQDINWVTVLPVTLPYGNIVQEISVEELHWIRDPKLKKLVPRHSFLVPSKYEKNTRYYWTSLKQLWDFHKENIPQVIGSCVGGEVLLAAVWNDKKKDRFSIIDSRCTPRAVTQLETFFKERIVMCKDRPQIPALKQVEFILVAKKNENKKLTK